MAKLDLTLLSPGDAQAALRSYPRRFESLLTALDNEDIDEIAHRAGPDGRSANTIVSDLTRTWIMLHEGLRRITTTDTPVLHAAITDASERHWDTPPPETVAEALTLLADHAYSFADTIDHVSTQSWDRTASIADSSGSSTITALGVVKEAVQIGHDALGDVERTLEAVRR